MPPQQKPNIMQGFEDFPDQPTSSPGSISLTLSNDDFSDFPDQPDKGWLQQWDESWINRPMTQMLYQDLLGADRTAGQAWSEYMDPVAERTEDQWKIPEWIPMVGGGTWRSLGAGLDEGLMNAMEGFTTPLNVASLGAGALWNRAAKTATTLPGLAEYAYSGAPKVAQGAKYASRTLAAPMAVSSAARINRGLSGGADYEGDVDWGDVGWGVAEAAGAGLGWHGPKGYPPARERIPMGDWEPTLPFDEGGMVPGATLPFDQPFRQQGRPFFTGETPPKPPPPPAVPFTAAEPTIPGTEPGPRAHSLTLKKPTPELITQLRDLGYEPGGTSPSGYSYMIRKDLIDQYELPDRPSAPEDLQTISPEGTTVLNKPSRTAIDNLEKQGFKISEANPETGDVTFKLVDEGMLSRFLKGEEGSFDPDFWRRGEEEEQGPLFSRPPKYPAGEPRGWEPEGTTPEQTDALYAAILKDMEGRYQKPAHSLNFTQIQSQFINSTKNVHANTLQNPYTGTGDYAGIIPEGLIKAYQKLDPAARVNLLRDFQQRMNIEPQDPLYAKRPANETIKAAAKIIIKRHNGDFTKAIAEAKKNQEGHNWGTTNRDYWTNVARELSRMEDEAPRPTGGFAPPLPQTELPPRQAAPVKGSGVIKTEMKSNVTRQARELVAGYTQPVPGIMVREGLQNAFDSFLGMFDDIGEKVKGIVYLQLDNKFIRLSDTGKGMSPEELQTVFTTLNESGKVNLAGAGGGKGIGKTPYILGGKYFEVTTVKDMGGYKIKSHFEGDPNTFFKPENIVIQYEEVDYSTPTGTEFKTTFHPDQSQWDANYVTDRIEKWSRDIPHQLIVDRGQGPFASPIKSSLLDKTIIEGEKVGIPSSRVPGARGTHVAEMRLLIPDGDVLGTRNSVSVWYLNEGLFQFQKHYYIGEDTVGMPKDLIVDIKSLVPEESDYYPFPSQRESLKDFVQNDVDTVIKNKLINPFASRKKFDLAKLWNQMTAVRNPGSFRDNVFFDPGDRLTPQENTYFKNSPVVQGLTQIIDQSINEIIQSTNYAPSWGNQLERVGITLDPTGFGIWIPNPQATRGAPKSVILVNPFKHLIGSYTPADAAIDMTTTMLHETAHIGSENPMLLPPFKAEDLADPRVGRYLQTYMREVMEQGGVDAGHGMNFIHRLGAVYATYGTRRGLSTATRIQELITDPNTGGYNREVQKLLQIYDESRGRPATTEDILSGTGIKSTVGGGRTGDVSSNAAGLGGGAARTPVDTGPGLSKKKEESILRQAYNLPRGATTTLDFSAPLRQGLPMLLSKEFYTSIWPMFQAWGSEKAYNSIMDGIRADPLFQKQVNRKTGKIEKSFADKSGLKLSDLANNREEAIATRWLEKVPGVRRSNRAYTAFLNKVRADSFKALVEDAQRISETAKSTGEAKPGFFKQKFTEEEALALDPTRNAVLAKEIADAVNTLTGRGPLRLGKEGGMTDFSQHAGFLTNTLFSPRLQMSRARMLNPGTYIMASPFVRKQYLKGALAVGAGWSTAMALGWIAGGEIGSDPNSADFGKIKFGDTRLDPAGGFQQYLVAMSRLASGGYTSSASGTEFTLGQGYQAQTGKDVFEQFATNKLHPVLKFAYDIADASEYKPFQIGDRTTQLFVPLIAQDLLELLKDDPTLLPLMIPISLGMGTQTYEAGSQLEPSSKFIPPQADVNYTGGGFPGLMRDISGQQ